MATSLLISMCVKCRARKDLDKSCSARNVDNNRRMESVASSWAGRVCQRRLVILRSIWYVCSDGILLASLFLAFPAMLVDDGKVISTDEYNYLESSGFDHIHYYCPLLLQEAN